jgi:hypothetical protein
LARWPELARGRGVPVESIEEIGGALAVIDQRFFA